jgi:hypothetical protein
MLAMQKKLEAMKLKMAESAKVESPATEEAAPSAPARATDADTAEEGGEESKDAFMERMSASRPQELILGDGDKEKKEEEEEEEEEEDAKNGEESKSTDSSAQPADQYLTITDKDTGETYHIDPSTGETVELDEQVDVFCCSHASLLLTLSAF